jgi:hypothetical protein
MRSWPPAAANVSLNLAPSLLTILTDKDKHGSANAIRLPSTLRRIRPDKASASARNEDSRGRNLAKVLDFAEAYWRQNYPHR